MPLKAILRSKGTEVHIVPPSASIEEAINVFRDEDIGAVVVSKDETAIMGILSERDVVRGLLDHGAKVLRMTVSDLMTTAVVTCTASDSLSGVMAMMTERRIRHIPVVENGGLCGIISIGDAVKRRLDELQAEADEMRDYIARGT